MTRRTVGILTAVGLLLMLLVAAVRSPLPFVTLQPGPTLDVLAVEGEDGEEPSVSIEGRASYPTDGELRLVTVSESTPEHQVGLVEALYAWWSPSAALIPRTYEDNATNEGERALSAAQMVDSQDTAAAAALRELGEETASFAIVLGVTPGGPSVGKLEVRDRLVSIDGAPAPDVDAVFETVGGLDPGDEVEVVVRREGETKRVRVETVADEEDPDRALIGIFPGTGHRVPFEVSLGIGDRIGGPSAGVVFALAIYDSLTPGSLIDGESIAGTGTIDADGAVGPIGGLQQKILGAARDGATLFLLPADNCDTAAGVPPDVDISLVPVKTLDDAIEAVRTHAQDPDAEQPRCPDGP